MRMSSVLGEMAPPSGSAEFLRRARGVVAHVRASHGFARRSAPLLTPPSGNQKLGKSVLPTYGLSLAPAASGGWNVCPWSTVLCRAGCLATAGRARSFPSIIRARLWRTEMLATYGEAFMALLVHEVGLAVRRHGRIGLRLNVLSDIEWEVAAPWLFDMFGDAVVFYDYTKAPIGHRTVPANYHLTYSVTERWSWDDVAEAVGSGHQVAVVVDVSKKSAVPETFCGVVAVDGDLSDQRWDDGAVAVLLRSKGELVGTRGAGDGFVKPSGWCQSALTAV